MNWWPPRRVAIITALSLIWAIAAGVHTHNSVVERAEFHAQLAHRICTDRNKSSYEGDLSNCGAARAEALRTWMKGRATNVVAAALIPLPFVWLAAFILLYVGRAQLIGFRAVVPWATLAGPRKLFVAFCCLFSGVSVLLGILSLLNLYVDTEVRVSPAPFLNVFEFGDSRVVAEGTWVRTDLTDDTIASPLQASRIECTRSDNRCVEALALVSGDVLRAEIVEYDVQSWTPDAIRLRREYLCAAETFTIDLKTKVVSGAGQRANENSPYCRSASQSENERNKWTYRLSNGFEVYWSLRQKARPWPMRVMQSIFGS
jgi:hypothetical protein